MEYGHLLPGCYSLFGVFISTCLVFASPIPPPFLFLLSFQPFSAFLLDSTPGGRMFLRKTSWWDMNEAIKSLNLEQISWLSHKSASHRVFTCDGLREPPKQIFRRRVMKGQTWNFTCCVYFVLWEAHVCLPMLLIMQMPHHRGPTGGHATTPSAPNLICFYHTPSNYCSHLRRLKSLSSLWAITWSLNDEFSLAQINLTSKIHSFFVVWKAACMCPCMTAEGEKWYWNLWMEEA